MRLALLLLAQCLCAASSLPIRGWSSWTQFRCHVNETLVLEMGRAIVASGLAEAGYNYVLLDDCWTQCDELTQPEGTCAKAAARDQQGRIPYDRAKFPHGMKSLTDGLHAMGLRAGIYTSIGTTTCAGFIGSKYHEAVDAATFAEWGFDFIKYANGWMLKCNTWICVLTD